MTRHDLLVRGRDQLGHLLPVGVGIDLDRQPAAIAMVRRAGEPGVMQECFTLAGIAEEVQ